MNLLLRTDHRHREAYVQYSSPSQEVNITYYLIKYLNRSGTHCPGLSYQSCSDCLAYSYLLSLPVLLLAPLLCVLISSSSALSLSSLKKKTTTIRCCYKKTGNSLLFLTAEDSLTYLQHLVSIA